MKKFLTRIFKVLKETDYRHYICVGITALFIVLNIFVFPYSFPRIWESLVDLGNSCAFYFREIFELDYNVNVTVNNFTAQPFVLPFNLPSTWDEFVICWNNYWTIWATKENFINYNLFLCDVLYYVSKVLIVILPVVFIVLVRKAITEEKFT